MSRIRSILRRTYGSDDEPSTVAVHVRWLREKLAVRFVVTAVAGSLLGIVLALIVSKPFFKAGFESFGIYSFNLSTSVISLVIPLVFMCVLFFVVAFIRAGNIRKVQPQVLIADQ